MMKPKDQVKEKYPFVVLLICDSIMVLYLLNISYIAEYYLNVKTLLGLCLIFMIIYSIKKRYYTHMSFYIAILITVHPLIYLGLKMDLAWKIVIIISLFVLIYLTYHYYPRKKTHNWKH
ncbi:MAG: hypothetical protein GY756_21555 [bacterium]|nr:hypothetical protein [bacterium]